jgi:hypothetical protein
MAYSLGGLMFGVNIVDSIIRVPNEIDTLGIILDLKLRYKNFVFTYDTNTFIISCLELLNDIEFYEFGKNEKNDWDFVRGIVDSNILNLDNLSLLKFNCGKRINEIDTLIKIPHQKEGSFIIFHGSNVIDFLGKIYLDTRQIMGKKGYNHFMKLLNNLNSLNDLPMLKFFKTENDAIIPTKSNESDVGYDLTIIKEIKKLGDRITLYDTESKQVFHEDIIQK